MSVVPAPLASHNPPGVINPTRWTSSWSLNNSQWTAGGKLPVFHNIPLNSAQPNPCHGWWSQWPRHQPADGKYVAAGFPIKHLGSSNKQMDPLQNWQRSTACFIMERAAYKSCSGHPAFHLVERSGWKADRQGILMLTFSNFSTGLRSLNFLHRS